MIINGGKLYDARLIFADLLEAYSYVALTSHHLLGDPAWVRAIATLGEMADMYKSAKSKVSIISTYM